MSSKVAAKSGGRGVAMRDVAEAAGVHVTTVSLALRNSPQLPVATRERIRALAEKMGYRVNPLLTALVQQRRTARSGKFQGALAFITRSQAGRQVLAENAYVARMFEAARTHAEELGFKLEAFEAAEFGSHARLEKALHTRGIRGVFLPPSDEPEGGPVALNWEHFAVVTFSTNLRTPPMDRVDTDHFGATYQAVHTAWRRGYRKPGFFVLSHSDVASQGRWRGGFLASGLERESGKKRLSLIPPLVVDEAEFDAEFERWLARWKPDVLVSNSLSLQRCEPVLQRLRVAVPDDLAVVEINIHAQENRHSGLYTCVEESSRRAIDQIVGKLYRNRLGLPGTPAILLTTPVWHEGTTLPVRSR
ncbi:LacI family transcriptional regulator [Opitutaceae bacterium TAV4]|nr:LacI family transcriptional regulator [Opitutaceae bacterium TAV4]RRJ99786.1 LacI family transcriptional regulator [Opitutaceae bacterium TAV3]